MSTFRLARSAATIWTPSWQVRRVVALVHLVLKPLVHVDLRHRDADARQLAHDFGDDLVRGDAVRVAAAVDLDPDDVRWFEEAAPRVSCVPAPVSVRMPCAIISRTTASSALPVAVSTALADLTATTRPGYGPGIPGVAAGV